MEFSLSFISTSHSSSEEQEWNTCKMQEWNNFPLRPVFIILHPSPPPTHSACSLWSTLPIRQSFSFRSHLQLQKCELLRIKIFTMDTCRRNRTMNSNPFSSNACFNTWMWTWTNTNQWKLDCPHFVTAIAVRMTFRLSSPRFHALMETGQGLNLRCN